MAESKKVVIKINIDKNTSNLSMKPPDVITVWHKQRIGMALVLLTVLLVSGIYWLSSPDKNRYENSSAISMSPMEGDKVGGSIIGSEVMSSPQIMPHAENNPNAVHDKIGAGALEVKREFAIIFDKAVVRASLNSVLKDNEPYSLVKSPIKLSKNQTIELFYFTELKGIKHKIFYHYWSKDGKLVSKKQLDVQRKHLKVNSANILSYNDKGNWQVQLVDKTGKIFSEVNFVVESE